MAWMNGGGRIFCIVLLCVCAEITMAQTLTEGLIKISEADYRTEKCRFMLQDEESPQVLFDPGERSFQVNRPLQVNVTKKRELFIRFYSPRPIRQVVIWARLPEMEEAFRLAELDIILPFAELSVPLVSSALSRYYITRTGRKITIPDDFHFRTEDLQLEIECEDPYYQKIVSNKCTWNVSFGTYRGKNWVPLLPVYAREAVAMVLNMAYLFSTEEFKNELYSFQGRLYKDNEKTPVEVNKLYVRIFNLPALVCTLVTGVNGMGGDNVLGLADWCYLSHYSDDKGITHTIFHEFAHCLGYTHAGNMTYENDLGMGWVALCGRLYRKMSIEKQLPVYSRRFLASREVYSAKEQDFTFHTSLPR